MIDEQAERKKAQPDGIDKFATGVAVLKRGKVLVVRRVKDDYLGGMYELPGGGVDEGETVLEGAIRELAEETGLKVTKVTTGFKSLDYNNSKELRVRQFNFVAQVAGGEVKLDPKEHDDYKWVGRKDIANLPNTPEQSKILYSVPGLSD